ncbi:MAG: hypothetical protein U0T84_00970 [Chitinophagales bacterium]
MKKIKPLTQILLFICAIAIIPSNFLSVWQIQLEAPQYPEGLKMEIWSSKISGDIDKINGLNHYIGMSQIKEETFPEFKLMPWLIWIMVALIGASAITGKLRLHIVSASYLVLCGIWGIYDFWKWEYEYGHNLNPHAAIKIPGMAYQPPLFGWKQLLNFLAGSFPDIGGWLIIIPSIVVVALLLFELWRRK